MSHVWGTIPEREVHQGACVVPQFCSVLCVEEDEEPAPLVEKITTRIELLYLHGVRLQYSKRYRDDGLVHEHVNDMPHMCILVHIHYTRRVGFSSPCYSGSPT